MFDTLATCLAFFRVFTQTIVEQDTIDDLFLAKVKKGVSVERVHFPVNDHVEFVAKDASVCQECHLPGLCK